MAKKQQEVDPMEVVYQQTDRLAPVFPNDTFWKVMKLACDAIREDKITDEVIQAVEKERDSWGSICSNKQRLSMVLDKMKN